MAPCVTLHDLTIDVTISRSTPRPHELGHDLTNYVRISGFTPRFLSAADRRRRRRCMSGNVRLSVCLSVPPHSRHLTTLPKSYQCEIAMVDAYCCKQHSGIGFMVEWFPVFQLRSKNLWFLAIFSHFCELLLHFWSKGANIAQEHSLEPP